MPRRNLAVELLQKLLHDEIKTRFRRNLVESRALLGDAAERRDPVPEPRDHLGPGHRGAHQAGQGDPRGASARRGARPERGRAGLLRRARDQRQRGRGARRRHAQADRAGAGRDGASATRPSTGTCARAPAPRCASWSSACCASTATRPTSRSTRRSSCSRRQRSCARSGRPDRSAGPSASATPARLSRDEIDPHIRALGSDVVNHDAEALRAWAIGFGASDAAVLAPHQVACESVRHEVPVRRLPRGSLPHLPAALAHAAQTRVLLDEYATILLLRFDVPPESLEPLAASRWVAGVALAARARALPGRTLQGIRDRRRAPVQSRRDLRAPRDLRLPGGPAPGPGGLRHRCVHHHPKCRLAARCGERAGPAVSALRLRARRVSRDRERQTGEPAGQQRMTT